MNQNELFEQFKDFLNSKPAAQIALNCLKDGVEIEILINNSVSCTLVRQNSSNIIENKVATSPDVSFYINTEAARYLLSLDGIDIAEFGIEVVKLCAIGDIEVSAHISPLQFIRNGYLNIVKEAGTPFASYLTRYGLNSVAKITEVIKSLRS